MASPSAVRDAGTSFIGGRIPMWVPVLLGFLTAVGPISTDIYLPAFPAMEQTFHTSAGNVQFTLSIWFVGLAIGQITVGPLSDRFGRRSPMLIGNACMPWLLPFAHLRQISPRFLLRGLWHLLGHRPVWLFPRPVCVIWCQTVMLGHA